MATTLIGNEQWSNQERFTQVFLATHDGEGNRLPPKQRSFISFLYDDKWIEDFGLIATFNDRLSKGVYAGFEDATTDYDTLDGQYYWGTRFESNSLEFTLSTDAMTQKQLDDFKHHFMPGKEARLILAENPNRWILARVASAPMMSMLPFKAEVKKSIGGTIQTIVTTEYRGDITLSFVMDEPHWHGLLSYIPNSLTISTISSATIIETMSNAEILKMCYEDNLPVVNSFGTSEVIQNIFFGDEHVVTSTTVSTVGVTVVGDYVGWQDTSSSSSNISISSSNEAYLFYSGTAPSYPKIEFIMNVTFDESSNKILHPGIHNNNDTEEYSYIQVGTKKFYFTAPGLIAAYNKAIDVLTSDEEYDIIELKKHIRDEVKDNYVRAYVLKLIEDNKTESNVSSAVIDDIKSFFGTNATMEFSIDSKTGECTCEYDSIWDYDLQPQSYNAIKENVGDMVRSDYLVLNERSSLDDNWKLTKAGLLTITSNESLSNFKISYDNMYL